MALDLAGSWSPAVIDLRSDTVTHPTDEMRRAMATAEVGDDVFGDDPTVRALEERAAELLGKEAGLFVTSGTQGNLVAQLAHLGRGQETIAAESSHIVLDEAAGHAVIVGTSVRTLRERADGTIDPDEIDGAFRDPTDPHEPISGMVTIENTHAHSMGQPLSVEYTTQVAEVAHRHGVPLHVDGARFFNAVVALGVSAAELAGPADSVTFCLSKGLACPVGSVVVGTRDFIWRARRGRKLVGGGLRQVGVLAAPGLLALRDGPDGTIERLADDHANARRLAEGLAEMDGVTRLDPARVRTNFVLFGLGTASWPADVEQREAVLRQRARFLASLSDRGVRMMEYPKGMIRAIPHYGVDAAHIETAITAARAALAEIGLATAVPR
jgi:threonine aldolase